jgi:hypothetical protein
MTDIACSLTSDQRALRLRQIQALCEGALIDRHRDASVVRLRFQASPATRSALEELVARERGCCPFLELHVVESEGALVLSVTGPPAARPVLDVLYTATATS